MADWTPVEGTEDEQILDPQAEHGFAAYVEQEITRIKHDPTTDHPSGRWIVYVGNPIGTRASKRAAKAFAERRLIENKES